MEHSKYKLILASQSPRRKELLGHLKVPFQIQPSTCEEVSLKTDPAEYVVDLAKLKARDILKQSRNDSIVVGADTVVVLNNQILEKPKNIKEARQMLIDLSGSTHEVLTGVCISSEEKERCFFVKTKVSFNEIKSELLELYLQSEDSLDKAGAYGIQGQALSFISRIDGSYSNVVGFPLSNFVQELDEFIEHLNWGDTFV